MDVANKVMDRFWNYDIEYLYEPRMITKVQSQSTYISRGGGGGNGRIVDWNLTKMSIHVRE